MSNLWNFNNLYADLAESVYTNRPTNFPPALQVAQKNGYEALNFSQDATLNVAGHSLGKMSFALGEVA